MHRHIYKSQQLPLQERLRKLMDLSGSENESEIAGFNFAALKRPLVMGVVCFGGV